MRTRLLSMHNGVEYTHDLTHVLMCIYFRIHALKFNLAYIRTHRKEIYLSVCMACKRVLLLPVETFLFTYACHITTPSSTVVDMAFLALTLFLKRQRYNYFSPENKECHGDETKRDVVGYLLDNWKINK